MERFAWTLGVAVAFSMGCGPVQSTSFLLDAEVQIEAARTAGADKYAPYEWTSANLYIHKAREEVSYSDFETGVEYAGKANKFAKDARDKAMSAAKAETPAAPSMMTSPPPPSSTP